MQASNDIWEPVPGTSQVEMFPLVNKPTIVTSNAYVLRTPFEIIIIDPGASSEQTEKISATVSKLVNEKPRPVFVVLTHAHQDHSQEVEKIGLPEGTVVKRIAHEECVDILARGDRWLTVAYLYPDTEVCRARFHLRLFPRTAPLQPGDQTVDLEDGISFRLRTEVVEIGSGIQVPRQSIQLGTGDWMQFYHTPGHSPDHLNIHLGRHLIIGDLPFGANPGVAGLAGWSQRDLIRSLQIVLWLMGKSEIESCLPGHGKVLPGSVMRKVLEAMESQAHGLEDIAVINPDRIRALKEYALDLLEESNDLFTIIAGRLLSLSHKLTLLEEEAYAENVLESFDFEAVDRTLTGFREYCENFRSEQQPDLSLALKCAQVVQKIERVFEGQGEYPFVSSSLTARAGRLLGDFMNTVRGLWITTNIETLDVNELVEGIVHALKAKPYDRSEILGTLDDDAAYQRALANRLAFQPTFPQVTFEVTPSARPAKVSVDKERVYDAMSSFLESIAGAGIDHARIQSIVNGNHVEIQIGSREPLRAEIFGERKLSLYDRHLAVNGGALRLGNEGETTVNLSFPIA